MAYYTVVVPLRFQDNLLSITEPLSLKVWICFLVSIPIYTGAIILMNYVYSGSTQWEATASSVIRSALSERRNRLPPKHLYQKVLVLFWSWMMFVLISAYKGNLLALITKPTLNTPFTNAEDMVDQTRIKWGYNEAGLFPEYAKSKLPGTALRKIYERAITSSTSSYCQPVEKESGNVATIADITTAECIIANDYSNMGTCNYYLTDDKILAADSALAFQVILPLTEINDKLYVNCNICVVAETKPLIG